MKKVPKEEKTIPESKVMDYMIDWAYKNGWGLKPKIKHGHKQGVDLELTNEKTKHKYFIECKGGGSHHEVNFIYSLGQIITRMDRVPRGVYYGLALPTKSANIARRRIPKRFASVNRITIFSVSNNGKVTRYTSKDF